MTGDIIMLKNKLSFNLINKTNFVHETNLTDVHIFSEFVDPNQDAHVL